MINTDQWGDLTKNALVDFREGYNSVEKVARKLYDVTPVSVQTSEHSQIDGFGFAKRKTEGGQYAIGSPKQGYSLLLSQQRIGLKAVVTWEMRKFDKYGEISKVMKTLGESTAMRIELDCTHQLTFGHSTSYTNIDGETISTATGDTKAIFATDHTITGGSGTWDNKSTYAFDREALEDMELKFTKMIKNNGMKAVVKPDTIITTDDPTLTNAVKEFTMSDKNPDSANQASNVYKGKYNHLVLPLLATDANGDYDQTKKNYWMLADLKHKDAILEVSEEPTFKAAKPDSNGEDFDTDDWKYKSAATYDLGFLDSKNICGSTGAA